MRPDAKRLSESRCTFTVQIIQASNRNGRMNDMTFDMTRDSMSHFFQTNSRQVDLPGSINCYLLEYGHPQRERIFWIGVI